MIVVFLIFAIPAAIFALQCHLKYKRRNVGIKQRQSWIFAYLGIIATLFFLLISVLAVSDGGAAWVSICVAVLALVTFIYLVSTPLLAFVQFNEDSVTYRREPWEKVRTISYSQVDFDVEYRGSVAIALRISNGDYKYMRLAPLIFDLRPLLHQLLFRETVGRWPRFEEIEPHIDQRISLVDFERMMKEATKRFEKEEF